MANEDKQNGIMSYSFGKPMAVEEEKAFSWYKDKIGMQQDTPPYRKNPEPLYKPSAWESMPDIKQVINMFSSKLLDPLGAIPSGQDLLAKYAKPTFAPEGGNLEGGLDGQLGYASTNTNDASSAVADAIIGVPTLTPAEQTKVDKALRAGLMARATEQGSKLDGADKADLDVFAWRGAGSNTERVANTALLKSSFKDIASAENPDDGAMVHLDSNNIITLLNGVVPTGGLTFRGRPINARDHTLTPAELSEVDYSNAVSQGINRSDYEDGQVGYDKWSKAVFTVYADKVREQAGAQSTEGNTNALVNNGVAFDDLPDRAKKMLYDVAWNAGEGSAKWSGVSTSAYEASKPIEDQTTENLISLTKHFGSNSNTIYDRGLLKRRTMQYNNIAKPGEIATNINTTPWNDTNGNRRGTTYAIQTANGTTLKTYNKPDLTQELGDLPVPQGG